ncbi:MAG: alpha/beta hydrolase [Anaerolineae bacterium]
MSRTHIIIVIGLLGSIGLSACATEPPAPTQVARVIASPTSISIATNTPTVVPTFTPTPTSTPMPTPTPHPLTIDSMRQRSYPGSDITIEQELPRGATYRQYIASYLSDGLKQYGLLTIPVGEKPATGWPAIIFNHGFIPPATYRTTERYVAYVAAIANSGYVVFKPDYRGHGDSEGEASGAYGSPDYVIDVNTRVDLACPMLIQIISACGDIPGRLHHAPLDGDYEHDQGRCDLGWRRRTISNLFMRPTATPTPEGATPAPTPTGPAGGRNRWRTELVKIYGTPGRESRILELHQHNSYLGEINPLELHITAKLDTSVPLAASGKRYIRKCRPPTSRLSCSRIGDNHNAFGELQSTAMQRSIQFFDKYVKNIQPQGDASRDG